MDSADILSALDIGEYIGQYVDLHLNNGELWGLSPFTNEKTPSFSVNTEKRCWKDFSSGSGGNVFDFIMMYHHVPLPKAIEMGREFVGDDAKILSSAQLPATKIAKKFGNHTRQYRESTSDILNDDYMEKYEFRRDKLKVWVDEGISYETMRRFGVRYSAFDDRIVFPIKNFDGQILCVSGRTCDPDYKSKGIGKYIYFPRIGTVGTIYGYSDNEQFVMEEREIILFEGAKSVMKAYQWGIRNTGAILTSHLNQNQLAFLIQLGNLYGVNIVFALDSDVDITKDKNITKLAHYISVWWVKNRDGLLSEKDSPVDLGEETFRSLYDRRERLLVRH